MYMFNKIKGKLKKALSGKPVSYTAKKRPNMSMGTPRPMKKKYKVPTYKGANFIK